MPQTDRDREAALRAAKDYLPSQIPAMCGIAPTAESLAGLILAQRREAKIEALVWSKSVLIFDIDAEIARLEGVRDA